MRASGTLGLQCDVRQVEHQVLSHVIQDDVGMTMDGTSTRFLSLAGFSSEVSLQMPRGRLPVRP